jgi:hypothetical protein
MFESIQSMIDDMTNSKVDISNADIHDEFKLPIQYLETDVYEIDDNIAADLEIDFCDVSGHMSNTMYDHLLLPEDVFDMKCIVRNNMYTTNADFLQETQQVIKNMKPFNENDCSKIDSCELLKVWKETKQNPWFLDKYCYIDWKIFRHFNESQTFLQVLSFMNMSSPFLALIVPLLFLIFPFLILKIQGIPISFTTYINTLKIIAKDHFIGKMLNIQNMKIETVLYVFFSIGFYCMQIYQNVNICMRFYNNLSSVNTHLSNMRTYIERTLHKTDLFLKLNKDLIYYKEFNDDVLHYSNSLRELQQMLKSIRFEPSIFKITDVGYLLKVFYVLHSNIEYHKAIQYSVGFNGYINNLKAILCHVENKAVNFATFSSKKTMFKDQYYPPLHKEPLVVKNDTLVNKSIITGPNASGKTTLLKTTSLNIIFTQQYGVGFYSDCVLQPYHYIHSYLNIPDTSGRDSLFQAEARRCKQIIDLIQNNSKKRHFVIFDELFSGTNPVEASKSAYAFLLYLSNYENVDFILTTHYTSICKKLEKRSKIKNYKMNVLVDDNKLSYTYKMTKGISKVQGALIVLEEMNFPNEIIDCIKKD